MGAELLLYLALVHSALEPLPKQADDWLPLVGGLLSSLLPSATEPSGGLEPLRAELAHRLRDRATHAWLRQADLAEVCAVLDGLHSYDSALVSGADLAIFIERLLAAEAAVGGPYRDANGSLQPLTNALVDQCLVWAAQPLPNVSAYLQRSGGMLADPDLSAAERTLLYALRADDGGRSTARTDQLQQHARLFIAALAAQLASAADNPATPGPTPDADPATARYVRTVHAYVLDLPTTAEPFASKTRQMLEQVLHVDRHHEITGIAWMYGLARRDPIPRDERTMYEHFGTANVYGWAAYTIYDDFLDKEGDSSMLGTANHLARAMLREYAQAIPTAAFRRFTEETLTVVDVANTYETTHLRFAATGQTVTIGALPNYDTALLADRTVLHIIGPMGVLTAAGEPIGSDIWQATLQAFRSYLIARQLNDDLHDWVKDLRVGQISYVVAAILRHLGTPPGVYRLDELIDLARPQFWQAVLPAVCDTGLRHIAAAKQLPLPDPTRFAGSPLWQLFDRVEASMHAALQQRSVSAEFVRELRL